MSTGLHVAELGPTTLLALGEVLLLVDCGEGTAARWRSAGLRSTGPDAILFTSGEARCIAGLYGLLASLTEAGRTQTLDLLHALDEERVGNLVGAWLQSERCPFPVALEADLPGATLEIGGLRCTSRSHAGGLAWRITGGGRSLELGALRG